MMWLIVKSSHKKLFCLLLMIFVLVLSGCSIINGGSSDGDAGGPGIVPVDHIITGKVLIPESLLAEDAVDSSTDTLTSTETLTSTSTVTSTSTFTSTSNISSTLTITSTSVVSSTGTSASTSAEIRFSSEKVSEKLVPAENVQIWLEDYPSKTVKTDSEGKFILYGIPAGSWRLVAKHYNSVFKQTAKARTSYVSLVKTSEISDVGSITLKIARNVVSGILKDTDGAPQPRVPLTLWGETFFTDSNGFFVSPPLPDGVAEGEIKVLASGAFQPQTLNVPFVSDIPSVAEFFLYRYDQTVINHPPLISLTSQNSAGKATNKINPSEQLTLSAVVRDPDQTDLREIKIVWSCTAGQISSGTNEYQIIWIAPSEKGVATITVVVSDFFNGTSSVKLPVFYGFETYPVNSPPEISFKLPSDKSRVYINEDFSIEANVSDDGKIELVELFIDELPYSSIATPPYIFTARFITEGTHLLNMRATDNFGAVASAGPLEIIAESRIIPVPEGFLPASGATNIASSTLISVLFNREMNRSSININSFSLRKINGQKLPGIISNENEGKTFIFTPDLPLQYATEYFCTLSSTIKDLEGTTLSENVEWKFTTASAPDRIAPSVIYVSPFNGEMNVEPNASITIKFSEPVRESSIAGNLVLKIGTETLSISVSMNSQKTQAIIVPSASLNHSRQYTLTAGPGITDLEGNVMLSVFSSIFETVAKPDVVPPSVVAVKPENGAELLPLNTKITISFSEPVIPESLTGSILLASGSISVAGSISMSSDKQIATFSPNSPLAYNSSYTVTVKSGVNDFSGNSLISDYSSVFSTTNVRSSEKTITSFSFQGLKPPANGIIDENSYSIVLKVSSGTIQNPISPTILHTGISVSPMSGSPVKFLTGIPVTYTVTAENGTTKNYSVKVVESVDISASDTWMNVPENRIYNVSPEMEYSLNDGSSWNAINSWIAQVSFTVNDTVWVRKAGNDSTKIKIGTVKSLSGSDLVAGNNLNIGKLYTGNSWEDFFNGSPNEEMKLKYTFRNIGSQAGYSADNKIRFYISTDRSISATDTAIAELSFPYECPVGEVYAGYVDFKVPVNLSPGKYFVGAAVDCDNSVAEVNDENNFTLPGNMVEFTIKDSTPILSQGAFKIVNSWGKSGEWEKKTPYDGHYWITYGVMKKQEMYVRYFYNDFNHAYQPTVLLLVKPVHQKRDECLITVGLGPVNSPVKTKELQSRVGTMLTSGGYSFPDNVIALDISEFASAINDYDLFIQVNNTGNSSGNIASFAVEYYYDYEKIPFRRVSGSIGPFTANQKTEFTASTKGSLTREELRWIVPLPRRAPQSSFEENYPSDDELQKDIESAGVFDSSKKNDAVFAGKFGTGFIPPNREQWGKMKKLYSYSSRKLRGTLPDFVDNSNTVYFPPIGNQGTKNSCTTWSMVYYIHTYNEAREHNWNLSGTSWSNSLKRPDSNLDKIFSPDFVYHQINSGFDGGSEQGEAGSLLARIGGATWNRMPVSEYNVTNWPSEPAWREAARYRAREVGETSFDKYSSGYLVIRTDDDINLLKALINDGYCISTSVKAGGLTDYGNNMYKIMTVQDVASDETVGKMEPNHAQTIVGYREGTSWDQFNPD
ncbi:MAG: Ig-like domain-containing protein [Candidatus Riflebacteria bacterium]|nr:Ig-like domain-containing protein [Candidatus Riflebacteria bacterium]